ncbi:MAG: bifunctional UDP-sugar hydrolase/5'-nucleotidase [Candidatus Muiribacteriota bacterium]
MKRSILLLLILISVISIYSQGVLRILHINDFHGHIFPKVNEAGIEYGGISRIASKINHIKKIHPDALVIDGGDFISGFLYANFDMGLSVRDIYKYIPFNAIVPGNHEFDYGVAYMKDILEPLKDKIILANVYDNGKRMFKPYIIEKSAGYRVLIFGVTTPDIKRFVPGLEKSGITVTEPVEEAGRILRENRNKADVFIMLSHCGFEEDMKVAEVYDNLDIIIGTHTHTLVKVPPVINNTIVTQTGAYGERLGYLRVAYENNNSRNRIKYSKSSMMIPSQIWGEVEEINLIANRAQTKVIEMSEEIIGKALTTFTAERNEVRGGESPLGNFIADGLKKVMNTDFAVVNGGGIRAPINAGVISNADLEKVLPFKNNVVAISTSGAEILKMFENSLVALKTPSIAGAFLQISGLKVVYDITNNSVEVMDSAGRKIEKEKSYTLALVDYILTGGDGYNFDNYKMLKENEPVRLVKDLVVDYIRELGEIKPYKDGRITVK